MSGPRIYTEAWERLKIAAKETEARELEEPRQTTDSPEKPKRLRGPRLFVIAIAVLAFLSILTAALWIDSQERLMTAARDTTDFKTRFELLQEKMKKVEEEKQRLEEENGTLSVQYEQRAAELAQVEEELNALRSQKDKSKPRPIHAVPAVENPPANAHSAPTAHEAPSPAPRDEKESVLKPQRPEQQDVKVYKVE